MQIQIRTYDGNVLRELADLSSTTNSLNVVFSFLNTLSCILSSFVLVILHLNTRVYVPDCSGP